MTYGQRTSLTAQHAWRTWSAGTSQTAGTVKTTLSKAHIPGYTTCIATTRHLASENLSKSQQVLGAKGYVYIPDPVVEQTDDGLVRVSVGDQIACISTTQPVQQTVHQLTMEWLLKYTPG